MIKRFGVKLILASLLISTFSALGISHPSATSSSSVPNFPSCTEKLDAKGDWSHSSGGTQYIVGIGNREGMDDVFQLSSGNFLQCFCPSNGTNGIQTNWWNIQRSELSQNQVNTYKNQGWMELAGETYNLYHEQYLAKNNEFTCSKQSPTPSVTPTSSPTPSASPAPTITSTPGPQSRCFDLEASPSTGSAPLTVKFTAHADDPVSGGGIKEYRFDFADTSGGQPQVWHQTDRVAYHRYELSGEYEASLKVRDNAGNWRESDDCKVKIKVDNTPKVLGISTLNQLPETGVPLFVIALVALPIALTGRYLYKRFRLV